MKTFFRTAFPVAICFAVITAHAHAAFVAVPEIDPSMAVSGLTLLAGAALIVRGRRRQ
jgi:LPXTG-motif cell wall-anchored protein